MSMMKRQMGQLINLIAYDLADATSEGPTSEERARQEDRLLAADDRHNGAILRLARHMGLCAGCGEFAVSPGSSGTLCPACWEAMRVEAARSEIRLAVGE